MGRACLNLLRRGKSVDIEIQDKDTCLLLDIFNELEEKARIKGMKRLENPSLTYIHRYKHVNVLEDKDTKKMFQLYPKKVVFDLWVWDGSSQQTVNSSSQPPVTSSPLPPPPPPPPPLLPHVD